MECINAQGNRTVTKNIDLRSDKLMIYGSEIKESLFQRLYESLILKSKSGIIYVNCNGACYFKVSGKYDRPSHNVIFDWSPYGVIVPNSTVDVLKKQLEQQEEEIKALNHKLSSMEVESETSKKESNEQLMTCQKNKHETEVKLEKVCTQLSLVDFELQLHKIELKSYEKEVDELKHRLSIYMEESECMEIKLQNVQDQLSLSKSELESMKSALQGLEDQLSSTNLELHSTNTQLEVSRRKVMELEKELSTSRDENQHMKMEIQTFKHQLSHCKKETLDMEGELQRVRDQLSATNHELHYYNQRHLLQSTNTEDLEFEIPIAHEDFD